MASKLQLDKVIASYLIGGYIEDDVSAEFITSSSSDVTGYWRGQVWFGCIRSHVCSPGNIMEKCHITIREPNKKIENPNNYTHVAHVAWGNWVANFLCSYDRRTGILHNATLVDMNENMQRQTGWRWEDDEEKFTKKDDSEDRQAVADPRIDKKSRPKTIALGTLKDKDPWGNPDLGLRTHSAGVWENTRHPEEPARKSDRTVVITASKLNDVGDEGSDENGYKSFTHYLEVFQARTATKT